MTTVANSWPPPAHVKTCLAKIDGVWIQADRETRTPTSQWVVPSLDTPTGPWVVAKLDSHGCGCCGSDDPAPTHWAPLP